MDPGYGFLNDFLLVASSRVLLKQSIDAYQNSMHSMVSDDLIGQFSLSSSRKFHSVTLMKTSELAQRAQNFLGWIDKYLSGQVYLAAVYKQDGTNKNQELDQALNGKRLELVIASKKLAQLKKTVAAGASDEDTALLNGVIANLSREQKTIRGDIADYLEQKSDLSRLMEGYSTNARSAKLTMYNMESFITPFLKGLESIDAQAITVRLEDKILVTELLVK
ncbi:MAG: hypothetical protein HQL13_07810, partial [Candidatus Omnitrophica bacterium]|nr:hypothetical protein [Candidatus Omnitrophota bacterium]